LKSYITLTIEVNHAQETPREAIMYKLTQQVSDLFCDNEDSAYLVTNVIGGVENMEEWKMEKKNILMIKTNSCNPDENYIYVGNRQYWGSTYEFLQYLRQPHTLEYDIRVFCWDWVGDAIADGDVELEAHEDELWEALNEILEVTRPENLTFDEALWHAECFEKLFELAVLLKEMYD
jgi:hypothetical protein